MKTDGSFSKVSLVTSEEGKEEKQNRKQGNSKRPRGFQRSLYIYPSLKEIFI